MKRARVAEPRARVLLFDIETAPILGTTWQKYEADLVWTIQDWYMLCFAYKWLGEKKTYAVAQPDFKGYTAGSPDDRQVVKALHELFSEADVLVAHNGDRFDVRKTNARFMYHRLGPPTPYQTVDTLKLAKKYFAFTSNKLDDLGEHLHLGRKIKTDKTLWQRCMAGDASAWRKMIAYNKQDVRLLEDVYVTLRPFHTSHPNMANISHRPNVCPRCESAAGMIAQGWRYTKTGRNQVFQCKSCGSKVTYRNGERIERPTYT